MRTPDLTADVAEILITEAEIRAKVAELGAQLSRDYEGRPLTLVSVLKGSLPFMADLMRAITIPVTIDLMEVSSYGGAVTETSGLVRILKDLSASIEGRDVLIVEDIIDTGLTLNYLLRYLRGKNPRSLRICALLDKPAPAPTPDVVTLPDGRPYVPLENEDPQRPGLFLDVSGKNSGIRRMQYDSDAAWREQLLRQRSMYEGRIPAAQNTTEGEA